MGGQGSGRKRTGKPRPGSNVWRLLQLKVGEYFYTTAGQRSFTSYFPRANSIEPDRHWSTQDIWAVPMNHSEPELIVKVTRVK